MIIHRLVLFLFCMWFLLIGFLGGGDVLSTGNEFLDSGDTGHLVALAINATYAVLAFIAAYWCAWMVQQGMKP